MGLIRVETFEVREDIQGIGNDDPKHENEAAAALARKLGLGTQASLREDTTKRDPPYLRMAAGVVATIDVLAPGRTKVDAYKQIMPFRVLEAYQQAQALECFPTMMIRHASNAEHIEPIAIAECYLVGGLKDHEPHWLIARWGIELLPWDVLEAKAKKEFIAEFKEKGAEAAELLAVDVARASDFADRFFRGVRPIYSYMPKFPEYRSPK